MLRAITVSKPGYLKWPATVGDFRAIHLGDMFYELRYGPIAQTGFIVEIELALPKRFTLYRVDLENNDAADDDTATDIWALLEVQRAGRWFKWGQVDTSANDVSMFAREGGERRGETRFRLKTLALNGNQVYISLEVEDRHLGI